MKQRVLATLKRHELVFWTPHFCVSIDWTSSQYSCPTCVTVRGSGYGTVNCVTTADACVHSADTTRLHRINSKHALFSNFRKNPSAVVRARWQVNSPWRDEWKLRHDAIVYSRVSSAVFYVQLFVIGLISKRNNKWLCERVDLSHEARVWFVLDLYARARLHKTSRPHEMVRDSRVETRRYQILSHLINIPTRKLSYRKDDRAMRPICECPENFRESLKYVRPRLIFWKFLINFVPIDLRSACAYKVWSS